MNIHVKTTILLPNNDNTHTFIICHQHVFL